MEEATALHSQPPQNTTAGHSAEIDRLRQPSPYRAIYIAASASVKKACRSSQTRMSAGKSLLDMAAYTRLEQQQS